MVYHHQESDLTYLNNTIKKIASSTVSCLQSEEGMYMPFTNYIQKQKKSEVIADIQIDENFEDPELGA